MKYKTWKEEKRKSKKGLTRGAFGKAKKHPTFGPDETNRMRALRAKAVRGEI